MSEIHQKILQLIIAFLYGREGEDQRKDGGGGGGVGKEGKKSGGKEGREIKKRRV